MTQTGINIVSFTGTKAVSKSEEYARDAIKRGLRVHPPSVAIDSGYRITVVLMVDKVTLG